jgi:hypothetical protein
MFNFEKIHKNHKLAYLDGLLTGAVLTYIGVTMLKEIKETRALNRLAKTPEFNVTTK